MPDLETSGAAGVAFVRQLGIDTASDPLTALRAMPARDLLAVPVWAPNVDGWVLPVTAATGPAAARVLRLLPASSAGEIERAYLQLMTYFAFTCPARLAARAVSRSGHPAYVYQFTRVPPGAEKLGAFHLLEIPYVFGNPPGWISRNDTDDRLSAAIMDYWVRFATTGDPNDGIAAAWPAYDAAGERYLDLGDTVTAKAGLVQDVCDALEAGMRAGWGDRATH